MPSKLLQRMRETQACASSSASTVRSCLNAVTRACRKTSTASLSASTNRSPALAQLSDGASTDLVEAVFDLRREADRAVAGNRPRRGRPDDDRCAQRKLRDSRLDAAASNYERKLHPHRDPRRNPRTRPRPRRARSSPPPTTSPASSRDRACRSPRTSSARARSAPRPRSSMVV